MVKVSTQLMIHNTVTICTWITNFITIFAIDIRFLLNKALDNIQIGSIVECRTLWNRTCHTYCRKIMYPKYHTVEYMSKEACK